MSEDKKKKNSDGRNQELEELKAKSEEYLSGWKRAKADYENLEKQTGQKVRELVDYTTGGLVLEVLNIYDHFKLALQHKPDNEEFTNWFAGISHIKKEFENFLEKFQVTEIKTIGEQFNPAVHEAVGYEESDKAENEIIRELRSGYIMNEKVIQPAQVIVAKKNDPKTAGTEKNKFNPEDQPENKADLPQEEN